MRVGEDLRDVSDVLCIRYLYLEAIEEGRYADLPGETYAIGFIRSYSEHLGLDGEEVVRRFRAEQAGTKRANDLAFPTPVPESGVPKGALVFVGVVIALLVYGGWYASTTDEDFFSELIAPVPDRLKNLVEEPPASDTPSSDTATLEQQSQPLATPAEIQSTPVEETDQEPPQAVEVPVERDPAPVVESATETQSADLQAQSEAVAVDPIAPEVPPAAQSAELSPTLEEPESVSATDTQAADQAAPETPATDPATNVTEPEQAAALEAEAAAAAVPETADDPQSALQRGADAPANTVVEVAETTAAPQTSETEETVAENDERLSERQQDAESSVVETPEVEAPQETITAEDLNAQSLRAATGQAVETASAPTEAAEEPQDTNSEPESAGVPGDEVLDESGAVSDTGISIRATMDSWVEITDSGTSSVVFTGLMRAGASFNVPDRDGLLLDTGNAGGLDFFVDGQPVPKIGGDGTVRKGVSLSAELLRSGTAANQ